MSARRTSRQLAAGLAAALAWTCASPAWAGQFSVSPVRIFMAPKDRAAAVTISNDGDETLVMQADVYAWRQRPDGEDSLELSEDLILSPPIIKLAPRARQVVRLASLRPSAAAEQATYRLVVREIPEAGRSAENVQLRIALAFSLPVFITPPGARRQVDCALENRAPNAFTAICANTGSAYAQLRAFTLTTATGDRIAARDSGGYLLPGSKRSFPIPRSAGTSVGARGKLVVDLDDGSAQSFDVNY